MAVKTPQDMFVTTLKDIYYAENKILKALPKMIKAADDEEVSEALEAHLEETRAQIERLDSVFAEIEVKPAGKKCEAIEGILKEGDEAVADAEGPMVNAAVVASGQAVEHYEIVRYRSLIMMAGDLDLADQVTEALQANLDEEIAADEKLVALATEISASGAADQEPADEKAA